MNVQTKKKLRNFELLDWLLKSLFWDSYKFAIKRENSGLIQNYLRGSAKGCEKFSVLAKNMLLSQDKLFIIEISIYENPLASMNLK